MRAALIAAMLPAVLAGWNPKACNGAGGCTQVGFSPSDPFLCPDGSRENLQEFAGDQGDAGDGNSEPVSKADFPKACTYGSVPPEGATLIKSKTRHNQTMYFYVITTCNDPNPPFDCYNRNPNPATHTFCAMFDSTGGLCEMNPKAGYCERWGYSTVNPQCAYWKPGLPDLPNTSR